MKTQIGRHVGLLAALLTIGSIAGSPDDSIAQILMCLRQPCVPCPTGPSTTAAAGAPAVSGSGAQPGSEAAETPSPAPSDLFAQAGAGAASGPESAVPSMVGDYLGGFFSLTSSGGSGTVTTTCPLAGGAIPRFKMAEDTSPLPVDRVYFNYDYYSNVPINANTVGMNPDINLNAYTPGFEKTFFNGVMSVELRLPMATTLSRNIFLDGTTRTAEGEVGNLGITVKALLLQSDTFAISAGLGIDCPTAPDSTCFQSQANPSGIQILNQSVHLLPFVGGLWTPNDRLFCLGFVQFDIDANGDAINDVFANGPSAPIVTPAGRYYEQTMIYLDGVAGYWIRRDNDPELWLNGVAVFGELHGNQSLNTSSGVSGTPVGNLTGDNISILDMTIGADFQFGPLTTVTAAYSTPLTSQREFDGQFRFMINRRF